MRRGKKRVKFFTLPFFLPYIIVGFLRLWSFFICKTGRFKDASLSKGLPVVLSSPTPTGLLLSVLLDSSYPHSNLAYDPPVPLQPTEVGTITIYFSHMRRLRLGEGDLSGVTRLGCGLTISPSDCRHQAPSYVFCGPLQT